MSGTILGSWRRWSEFYHARKEKKEKFFCKDYSAPWPYVRREHVPYELFRIYSHEEIDENPDGPVPDGPIGFYFQECGFTIGTSYFNALYLALQGNWLHERQDIFGPLDEYDRYYSSRKDRKILTFTFEDRIMRECGSCLKMPPPSV